MKDLVERAIKAYRDARHESYSVDSEHERMEAVAKVLLDAALGDVTREEAQFALKEQAEFERTMTERHKYTFPHSVAMRIIANRKARLLAPKTVEISVEYVSARGFGWKVFADGDERGLFSNEADAQTFKAGLIAEMKEQA